MTRLDIPAAPADRSALKQEIKQEIKKEQMQAKLLGCGGCALILVVLLAIPTYVVAATLARTGFFNIPVLSERLYKPSEPVRRVMPLVGSNASAAMAAAGAKAKFDPHTSLLTLKLTETDLTTLAQEMVRTAKPGELPIPIRDIQIAVDEDRVELFAVSPQEGRDATVRLRFQPMVNRGVIDFEIQEALIGSLKVPKGIAQIAFGSLAETIAKGVLDATKDIGSLYSIATEKGAMRFLILPKNVQ